MNNFHILEADGWVYRSEIEVLGIGEVWEVRWDGFWVIKVTSSDEVHPALVQSQGSAQVRKGLNQQSEFINRRAFRSGSLCLICSCVIVCTWRLFIYFTGSEPVHDRNTKTQWHTAHGKGNQWVERWVALPLTDTSAQSLVLRKKKSSFSVLWNF